MFKIRKEKKKIYRKEKENNTTLVNGTRIALTCVTESNLRLKSPFLSFARHVVSSLQFSSPLLRSFGPETNTDGRAVKNARGTAALCTTLARVRHTCVFCPLVVRLYIYVCICMYRDAMSGAPSLPAVSSTHPRDGRGRCVRAQYID